MSILTLALAVLSVVPALAQDEGTDEAETTVETVVEKQERDVVKADTLWDLAQHFYKDPWQWTRIYEANKDQIRDPHWIYPNQILVIPGFDREVQVVKTGAKPPRPPAPEPAPEAAPEPAAPPVEFVPDQGSGGAVLAAEGLSTKIPVGMTAGEPSVYRMKMPAGWKAQGRVVPYGGREAIAGQGDEVTLDLYGELTVRRGTRFTVWRMAAPTEADADQKATYAQKIGLIEAVKRMGKTRFRAVVLRSGSPVIVDDLVVLGE
ncbi:MAG: LysM peptidoglycan-binding domain-containing protein [Elusimicrobia bacterium]|nr:LysM peptidoglycan-binding domain-containing protein [Elusimicrobiota bacterium]